MRKFRLYFGANTNGTHRVGGYITTYKTLAKLFGKPIEGDGSKVSGEWVFTDDAGNVVTLYDYKMTALYDESYPSVEEFRASNEAVEFSVGGRDKGVADAFIKWLSSL